MVISFLVNGTSYITMSYFVKGSSLIMCKCCCSDMRPVLNMFRVNVRNIKTLGIIIANVIFSCKSDNCLWSTGMLCKLFIGRHMVVCTWRDSDEHYCVWIWHEYSHIRSCDGNLYKKYSKSETSKWQNKRLIFQIYAVHKLMQTGTICLITYY